MAPLSECIPSRTKDVARPIRAIRVIGASGIYFWHTPCSTGRVSYELVPIILFLGLLLIAGIALIADAGRRALRDRRR